MRATREERQKLRDRSIIVKSEASEARTYPRAGHISARAANQLLCRHDNRRNQSTVAFRPCRNERLVFPRRKTGARRILPCQRRIESCRQLLETRRRLCRPHGRRLHCRPARQSQILPSRPPRESLVLLYHHERVNASELRARISIPEYWTTAVVIMSQRLRFRDADPSWSTPVCTENLIPILSGIRIG
jgi:hypothetical protein